MDHLNGISHFFAKVGLIITGGAVVLTWLQYFDSFLRVILSIVGIIAATLSSRYYYRATQKLDEKK
jgi:hypothetical protein